LQARADLCQFRGLLDDGRSDAALREGKRHGETRDTRADDGDMLDRHGSSRIRLP